MGLEGLRGANLGCPLVPLLCALPGLGSFNHTYAFGALEPLSLGSGNNNNNYQFINKTIF